VQAHCGSVPQSPPKMKHSAPFSLLQTSQRRRRRARPPVMPPQPATSPYQYCRPASMQAARIEYLRLFSAGVAA
jgi:hypothetical protein